MLSCTSARATHPSSTTSLGLVGSVNQAPALRNPLNRHTPTGWAGAQTRQQAAQRRLPLHPLGWAPHLPDAAPA